MNQDSTTPRCYNREPIQRSRIEWGISRETGMPVSVLLTNDWFEERCVTHEGSGIGPNNESYPAAHGWLPWCASCRWNPEGQGNVVEE